MKTTRVNEDGRGGMVHGAGVVRGIHAGRLALLAIKLLESQVPRHAMVVAPSGAKLDFGMFSYMHNGRGEMMTPDDRECATSCCFIGFAPLIFPECADMPRWEEVRHYVLGTSDDAFGRSIGWFLFGSFWPNSPKQAAARALIALTGGIPPRGGWRLGQAQYFTKLNVEELIERLKQFI